MGWFRPLAVLQGTLQTGVLTNMSCAFVPIGGFFSQLQKLFETKEMEVCLLGLDNR